MYRNLNLAALGITGRQSELIELALTYGFRGLDLEIGEMVKRARSRGLESARRFLASADIRVGEFSLPINWQADEATYRSGCVELNEIAEIASSLGAFNCVATVMPVGDNMSYQENFELHRRRFGEIADVLASKSIRLGLTFLAAPAHREGHEYPFIHQAETLLTLIKTIGNPNVGLTLDTWNWYVGGGALDQIRELPCEQIVSVRMADFPASIDVSTISESDRYLPDEDGIIDSAAIVRHLAENNYAGPLTLYPVPARFAGMTRDAIVQQTSAAIDALYKSAGLSRSGKLEPVPAE
jgi:sugar phosphate isomerase/epimerase